MPVKGRSPLIVRVASLTLARMASLAPYVAERRAKAWNPKPAPLNSNRPEGQSMKGPVSPWRKCCTSKHRLQYLLSPQVNKGAPARWGAASGRLVKRMENLKLISAAQMRDLCGGISQMTEWRWQRDPELEFPTPVRIRGRVFYREAEATAWLERQAEKAGA